MYEFLIDNVLKFPTISLNFKVNYLEVTLENGIENCGGGKIKLFDRNGRFHLRSYGETVLPITFEPA